MLWSVYYQTNHNPIPKDCGHIGDEELVHNLNNRYNYVLEIQVDGDELEHACKILGRPVPPNRVYTFVGDTARELAKNWVVDN